MVFKFKRNLTEKLLQELENPKISIVFGPRQTGKSYLMNFIASKVKKDFSYYDLEQPSDLSKFAGTDAEIEEVLLNSGKTVFVDEFHYLKNAGKIFKGIYDLGKKDPSKQIKIFASSSSAIEMHSHNFNLMPMTLEEYLSIDKADLSINEYFVYGGMPETYQYSGEERETYLNGVLETYIQRDIKSMLRAENISSFNKLLFMLASNQGQVVSVNKLANDLTVSAQTVQSYLDILEKTYSIYTLKSFSNKLSNELKKSRKYYFYDLGIKNALIKDFGRFDTRKDLGCIMESYAYHYLLSIANKANTDIFFWRTSKGAEVDFIWKKNQNIVPIEVKHKYESKNLTKGLQSFFRYYPLCQKAVILFESSKSFDEYEEVVIQGRTIYFIKISVSHKYLAGILQEI